MLASRPLDSDIDLINAWRQGDNSAGAKLWERYFKPVCNFFRNKLGDDVDDLVQQTFLACVENKEAFRGDATYRGYLFGIARNVLMDHLRARYRNNGQVPLEDMTLRDLGTSPSSRAARSERQALLLDAMDRIPLDFRIALELTYDEGLSGKEVAEALGVNPNTVRSRVARAKAALREQLAAVRAEQG